MIHKIELLLSTATWHKLLPWKENIAQRFKTSKPIDIKRSHPENSRLWIGKSIRHPHEGIHSLSCHIMVSTSRCAIGVSKVFKQHRHLVSWVYIRRNVQHEATIPRPKGRRRAYSHIQDRRNTHSRNMAWPRWHAPMEELRVLTIPT